MVLAMKIVARATSAAPDVLPAAAARGGGGQAAERVPVDGGLVANNPVTLAYFDGIERSVGERDAVIVVFDGTSELTMPRPRTPRSCSRSPTGS
jgi:hypothetical protein